MNHSRQGHLPRDRRRLPSARGEDFRGTMDDLKTSSRNDPAAEPVRIIAGSGRSGTSWLLDAVADANALRPVFEPLHPLAVPEADRLAYRYFPPTLDEPFAQAFLADVFAGNLHNWWTDYRVRPDRLRPSLTLLRSIRTLNEYRHRWHKLLRARRRYREALQRRRLIVKFIRANLMLDWISARYDARIVLLLRHPGAVVESRLRLGGEDWQPHEQLARYLQQPGLQQDFLASYNHVLRGPLSDAEAHAAIWCIENQVPLKQSASGRITVVHYEHLASDREPWAALLKALELEHLPETAALAKPSNSAGDPALDTFTAEHARNWRERLNPASRRQIDGMLRAMDVGIYRMDDPMPKASPWISHLTSMSTEG
jgi:hypothetical protein